MTDKAVEEKRNKLVQLRRSKLAQLSGKANEIEHLMDDDANVSTVKQKLRIDYQELVREFGERNYALQQFMPDEDFTNDHLSWYEPKASEINIFVAKVERWMQKVEERAKQAKLCDEEVKPTDSVSTILSATSRRSRKRGSETGSSVSSTASSVFLKAEVERAALLAKAAALKQKQDLERQEVGARNCYCCYRCQT